MEKHWPTLGFRLVAAAMILASAILPAYAKAQERRGIQDWDGCRTVWYNGKENWTLADKMELFSNHRADRELTAKELDCVFKAGDYLMDKRNDRYFVALWLGDFGHMYGLPSLIAVLRDKSDDPDVRSGCITALGRIADDRVIEPLIEVLGEFETQGSKGLYIARNAHDELNAITHAQIRDYDEWEDTLPAIRKRKDLQAKWREWWAANRDKITPDRAGSANEY